MFKDCHILRLFLDNFLFFFIDSIRDIVLGAKILKANPKTIKKLRVFFDDGVSTENRKLMIASMVHSCSRVKALDLYGFRLKDFQTFESDDLSQVFPNVVNLTLYKSDMPFNKLKSLVTIEELTIWDPPKSFLLAQSGLIELCIRLSLLLI